MQEGYRQNYSGPPTNRNQGFPGNNIDPRIQDPRGGYNNPSSSIDRRSEYQDERSNMYPTYSNKFPPSGNIPDPYSGNGPYFANNPSNIPSFPNQSSYVPSQHSNPNYSNNPQFSNVPQGNLQQYPKNPEYPQNVNYSSYPNSGFANFQSDPKIPNQGFPSSLNNPYPNQFLANPNQNIPNRQPVNEVTSTNAYGFYQALDKNIPNQRRDPEPKPLEIKPPNREVLETAEKAISAHPYNKIVIDIGNFLVQYGINLYPMFTELDTDMKDVIKKRDFIGILENKCGLARMNILSSDEIYEIADIFDLFKQSLVYYKEFLKKVKNSENKLTGPEVPKKIDPE